MVRLIAQNTSILQKCHTPGTAGLGHDWLQGQLTKSLHLFEREKTSHPAVNTSRCLTRNKTISWKQCNMKAQRRFKTSGDLEEKDTMTCITVILLHQKCSDLSCSPPRSRPQPILGKESRNVKSLVQPSWTQASSQSLVHQCLRKYTPKPDELASSDWICSLGSYLRSSLWMDPPLKDTKNIFHMAKLACIPSFRYENMGK